MTSCFSSFSFDLIYIYIYVCVVVYSTGMIGKKDILFSRLLKLKKKHFSFQPCEFRLPEDFTRNGNQIFLLNGIH